MNMKHIIYTLLLLTIAPLAAAQDYEISGTQGESIVLNISGFADERSTFAYAQTSGGTYTSDGFNKTTGQISFTFETAADYSFDFYEDLNSCINATSVLFKIKEKPIPEPLPQPEHIVLDIPNIFTPNGDGINDLFHIKFSERPQLFSITIFNRKGKKLFSSNDPNFKWDGGGNRPGTYFYMLNYSDIDGSKNKSGHVMIAE